MKQSIWLFAFVLLFLSCSGSDGPTGGGTPLPTPNPEPPTNPTTYSDTELLEMVKKDVTKYFWDYAETNSKLARERYHTDNPALDQDVVTTGGSGFGILTILVAERNGFVSRSEAVGRFSMMLDFLEKADRFHGAWPHWIDGKTGNVKPFSTYDDGGDLVETAFLAQSLIVLREYFKNSSLESEKAIAQKADALWKGIEWSFYTQNQNTLYWHYSPNYQFQIGMKLQGFDETLITYVLAASSPTYPISKAVYDGGWARSGNIRSASSQYGIPVLVNHNGQNGNVGPMFWSHYSFLALDPRGLSDSYVNYGQAVENHAKIQHQYAIANPKGWSGYGTKSWGLTASYSRNSDGSTGYSAHAPNNDLGVISPTAALSSMPYVKEASMSHLRYLYNEKKSQYVGEMGPYDAYSDHFNWVTPRYLAIDQGTISPMIENAKDGFIWNLFMNAPEIKEGLTKLGFHSSQHGF